MKKTTIFFLLMMPFFFSAQNSELSVGIGAFGSTKFRVYNYDHTSSGFGINLNYGYKFSQNKIIGSLILGPKFSVVSSESGTASYVEAAVLYAREFPLNGFLALEPAAGVGFYSLKDNSRVYSPDDYSDYTEIEEKSGVSVPLRLNIVMDRSRNFSYGFSGQYAFSKPVSLYYVSTFARFSF